MLFFLHCCVSLSTASGLLQASFVDFCDPQKLKDPVQGALLLSHDLEVAACHGRNQHGRDVPLLCLGGDHFTSTGTVLATRKR